MLKSKFDSVILMGPLATGKSTLAFALSERLNCPNYPIDKLKWYYRFINGYNLVESRKILSEKGFGEFLKYAQDYFTADDLEDVFSQFRGVVDLGATDSFCDQNEGRFNDLSHLFKRYQNIFLVLPSADPDECEHILKERLELRYENIPLKKAVINSYFEMNRKFINSTSNHAFSKHIIYTQGRTVEEIADEIYSKCIFSTTVLKIANQRSKRAG